MFIIDTEKCNIEKLWRKYGWKIHISNLRYNLVWQHAELRYEMDISGFLEDEKT